MSEPGFAALVERAAVVELVGQEAFTRASALVRSGGVRVVELDEDQLRLTGRVSGTHRDEYAVAIQLLRSPSGRVAVQRTRCSCPIVTDCKHVAAVLLTAAELPLADQLRRPEWERTLGRLLSSAPPCDPAPLALEFGVERVPPGRGYAGRLDLRIRPARRSPSGAWVRSGISWDDLDHVARTAVPEHRELLLQFRAAVGRDARYRLPRGPWLSLSTVTSGFWRLLADLEPAGVAVLAEKPLPGPRWESGQRARVEFQVRRTGEGLAVTPTVLTGDQHLAPDTIGLIGEPAHGVFQAVCDAEAGRLALFRLQRDLDPELARLLTSGRALEIPGADEPRFLAGFAARLQRDFGLSATDPAVVLPAPQAPVIDLDVAFEAGHRVRLAWSIRYGDGPDGQRFELDAAPGAADGVRDPAAEARLLANLPLPYNAFPQLAALTRPDRPRPAARATLVGVAAGIFIAEVLPRLRAAGVAVTTRGRAPDYRLVEGLPVIEVCAVKRRDSGDWFDLAVTVALDGEQVPFDDLFVALSAGDDHLILPTGVYFPLDRPEFDRLRRLIEEASTLGEPRRRALSISRYQTSLWEELVDLGAEIKGSAHWRHKVRELTGTAALEPVPPPATLAADLRPYQLDGFRRLNFWFEHGLGGILADDMGLGKTLQALALICRAVEGPDRPGPFLVVAPTSVLTTWMQEARRFAPGLRVTSVAGRQGSPIAGLAADADLVVTSYAVLRLDAEAFAEVEWAGLILDEAQFAKNHRTRTYRSLRRIPAGFRLAITGTPLENSLLDLWALFSLVAPGLLADQRAFAGYYQRPIERSGDQARLAQLRRRIRPLLLRRTKESVAAELPPKQEQIIEVELHPRHRRIYQTHLQRERQKVLGLIDDLERNRFTVLRSLTLLRRLSLDPGLVDPRYAGVAAAKVERLVDDLAELVAEGHQALVFSQFSSFLRRIRERLDVAGIASAYLDGQTVNRDRPVEDFRSGRVPVFLISLKAGGFGLNLTEADYCFLMDPWWNPAAERQAVDRAHRIGQTRQLMAYRMVAAGTIEEKVMDLKARKSALFDAVLGGETLAAARLTAADIGHLLSC